MSREPSLFDFEEVEAKERELAEWRKNFERADWVAPYETASGLKKGDVVLGWRCPACWDIEPNEFLLELNHCLSPNRIGRAAKLTECSRMELHMAHAIYDRRQREKAGA
ncbi:hypothetical protein CH274_15530 [Rhodococcus sp. 06-418-5]|uniref:hypothetical protein n=1 Tax=Rhodococcus sp. 06-418-5 TaxID=2022507 RepID=UPI000B9B0576|nr:hypothetical protein [Rhodococcus sp. 06-418-5]OZC80580.1 hypothetical protein CH274_15530 [Rhodococcus sp. 06-418-5]